LIWEADLIVRASFGEGQFSLDELANKGEFLSQLNVSGLLGPWAPVNNAQEYDTANLNSGGFFCG
jgi:hypothetical protein